MAGLVASSGPANAAFVGQKISTSNFEIDTDANFVQDDASPSIDWLPLGSSTARGVIQPDKINGTGDNSFGGGTAENDPVPKITTDSIPPNKSDLTNFGSYQETVGAKVYLHLLWTRVQDPTGSTNMDFEFNKSSTLSSNGVTPVRSDGDLLIEYHLANGGSVATLSKRTWDNTAKTWGAEGSLSGNAIGSINTSAILSGDAGQFGAKSPRTFGEASIDLTSLFGANTCAHFGYAYLKSRASDSFSSEIKDFTTPANVNVNTCGTIVINKTAQNGNSTFGYTGTGPSGVTLPTGFSSFNLTTASGSATRTFSDVVPGSYTVTEGSEPTGWSFVSLSCSVSGSGTTASQDGTVQEKANIALGAGGTATCTYTNRTKLSPTIATVIDGTTPATASGTLGSSHYDTATLSGATSGAGGTVTYTVYKKNANDNLCTTPAVAGTDINAQPAVVNVAAGSVPNSDSVTFLNAGAYWFQAVYSGDTNNNGYTSPCTSEPITISKAPTGVTTAQDLLPNDSFTLTGATSDAGGTITFGLYGPSDTTCTGTALLTQTVNVSGNGTYSTSNSSYHVTAAGTYRWKDVYSGDSNNQGVTSACGTEQFTFSNS